MWFGVAVAWETFCSVLTSTRATTMPDAAAGNIGNATDCQYKRYDVFAILAE
jgi:hypothetical protein